MGGLAVAALEEVPAQDGHGQIDIRRWYETNPRTADTVLLISYGAREWATRSASGVGLLPTGLVFSACGNTPGRPGGAAAGASMAR